MRLQQLFMLMQITTDNNSITLSACVIRVPHDHCHRVYHVLIPSYLRTFKLGQFSINTFWPYPVIKNNIVNPQSTGQKVNTRLNANKIKLIMLKGE